MDSNHRMTGSKPVALPLGYNPMNGGEWIRTTEPEGADLQSAAFSQTSLPLHVFNTCLTRLNYTTENSKPFQGLFQKNIFKMKNNKKDMANAMSLN